MKTNVSLLVVFLAAIIGIGLFTACRDDVYLPPPPSIIGCYTGTYTYVTKNSGEIVTSKEQVVVVSFTDTKFFMDADTTAENYDTTACFCKGRCFYSISDRVQIEPTDPDAILVDDTRRCNSCNPDESPQGTFQLYRPGSNVKLECIETVTGDGGAALTVTKTLMLTPVTCPDIGD